MHIHSGCIIHEHATRKYFKNIWTELSYEFGPSCLINLGRVGMGRVLCGPSWHGPSWFWAELSVIHFQQCDILTSVESKKPLQHPFKLRNSK